MLKPLVWLLHSRNAMMAIPDRSLLIMLLGLSRTAWACTNFMVSPGASDDGSALLSYSCDDGSPYAALIHYPAKPSPSKRELTRRGCSSEGPVRGCTAKYFFERPYKILRRN